MINNSKIKKVLKNTIKDNKVLLAFSGGPDSTFLLEVLASHFKDKIKDKVILAYVNYHDSEYTFKEEEVVSFYTKKYKLNRYQLHIKFDKNKDHNFEEWAREIRYKFFKDICKIENISYLLVAHHKDDLVETYLIQKERKILPKHYGLVSFISQNGLNIVRPLLFFYKNQIKEYLENNNYLYYDDITNYDNSKKRNEIRINNQDINKKEKLVKEINKKNKELDNLYKDFSKTKENNYSFYLKLSEDNKKRYIYYLLDKLDLSVKEKERSLKLCYDYLKRKEQGILNLDNQYKLFKLNLSFIISKGFKFKEYKYEIKESGIYDLPYFKIDLTKPKLFNIKSFPIVIRNIKKGDKISTNLISKDVHSFIKKQKVPLYYREIYPILEDSKGNIFYVPFYIDIKKKKLPIYFHSL